MDVKVQSNINSGHIPVLAEEVLSAFSPFLNKSNLIYFDGTFGRGGHYKLIKSTYKPTQAVVYDQDPDAIKYGQIEFAEDIKSGLLQFRHTNFSNFTPESVGDFDMMLLDLGVSSPQLDQAGRGFSFYHSGPLDMRMNPENSTSAQTLIHELSEDELNRVFIELGEIRSPYRVTRALVHDRKTKTFETTRDLAGLIERVDGWRQKGIHPATKYFMALRLAVNNELDVLRETLPVLMKALKIGGRMAVITFHSLEDRIVKTLFKESSEGFMVNKKVIIPSDLEVEENPRARSAKLRIFQRGARE